jgi:hypothetical protein
MLLHNTASASRPGPAGFLGYTRIRGWKERLEDHIELFGCYYNFIRPHRALKFGREVRTPAMQAGLSERQLTLRHIFSSRMFLQMPKNVIFVLFDSARPVTFATRGVALVA